jgi:thiaminase
MTAISNLFKATQSQEALAENQDSIDSTNRNAKCSQKKALSIYEIANRLEQEFYNRACGCSVKAQEDNLFDYKSFVKI